MITVSKSFTMPEDYIKYGQIVANSEHNGNWSAMLRELLRSKLCQYDILSCSSCGKLGEVEDMRDDGSGYICGRCVTKRDDEIIRNRVEIAKAKRCEKPEGWRKNA